MTAHFPDMPEVWPLQQQSVEVPGSQQPGFSPIIRNAVVPELTTTETFYDLFAIGRDRNPSAHYLGRRPWDAAKRDFAPHFEWLTYAQVEEQRTALGSAMSQLQKDGVLGDGFPATDWTLATWIQNRPEFQIVEHAAAAYSRRTVGLYESYDKETALYVLEHSDARVVFTTSSHVPALLSGAEEIPKVKLIVLLDAPSGPATGPGELSRDQLLLQWAKSKGITLSTWDETLAYGRAHLTAHNPPKSNEEILGFCYTSGTTGKPKGALVAHRQVAIAAASTSLFFKDPKVMISYLPLAHIYERVLECLITRLGGAIGYFSGDVLRLMEDAQVLKPEIFPGVPRVFNRIAAQIQAQADGPGLKGKLLTTALNAKIDWHDKTGEVTHAFYDRLVFRKVRAVLGGRVEFMVSGSAPIRPNVLKLLRVAFSADIREGYGQTENAGSCLIMFPGDKNLGSCGPPVPGTALKLRDVPELGYTSADKPFRRGEILSKSMANTPGYYKDEEKTHEALTEDGFLRTGDIGLIDEFGRVKIIDRVKNLVKLSQGEYIALENVEQLFSSSKLVAQLWLYGDSTESHLVAIAVPDPETFAPWASKIVGKALAPTDVAALETACQDPAVVKAFLLDLVRVGREAGLKGFEFPRALLLRMEPFTVENQLITPTFKLQRHKAKVILAKELQHLYSLPPAEIGSSKL